jgi:hypothetical protein
VTDRVYKETKNMNCRPFLNYLKNKSRQFNADRRNPVEPSCQKETMSMSPASTTCSRHLCFPLLTVMLTICGCSSGNHFMSKVLESRSPTELMRVEAKAYGNPHAPIRSRQPVPYTIDGKEVPYKWTASGRHVIHMEPGSHTFDGDLDFPAFQDIAFNGQPFRRYGQAWCHRRGWFVGEARVYSWSGIFRGMTIEEESWTFPADLRVGDHYRGMRIISVSLGSSPWHLVEELEETGRNQNHR